MRLILLDLPKWVVTQLIVKCIVLKEWLYTCPALGHHLLKESNGKML